MFLETREAEMILSLFEKAKIWKTFVVDIGRENKLRSIGAYEGSFHCVHR